MDSIAGLFTWFASTSRSPYMLAPRAIAGLPLLGIGLAHILTPDAPMQPIIEAMALPMPALLAATGVVSEIVAGILLLSGAWARLGGLLGVATMAVALLAHVTIEVWPNPGGAPPLPLPIVVLAASAVVLWRGAGRWSVDLLRAPAH